MKQANEWMNEVGETVMLSAFAGSKPPGIEFERLVERIQADALEHATQLLTANADSPERGFNAVYRLMLKLQNAKSPNAASERRAGENLNQHD